MYDMKNEANEFVGDDRREAVQKACRFFDAEEAELKISDTDPGEIFGLGNRVVVVAVPKSVKPRPRGGDSGEGRDRGRGRGRERDRGRDRDRGRGRDRARGSENHEREHVRTATVVEPEEEVKPAAPVGESRGVIEGKVGEVGNFLLGIVERMGLGSFRLSESSEGDFTIFEFRGEAAVTLGAGDGRAVDALQLLGNQAAMQISDDAPRIVVDAEGNAERRSDFLARLAERAVKRALDTDRSVALDPMNARDRRVLHMEVRDIEGVATMSIGAGRYRQVVVVPEGSPDYDEAIESSAQNDSERASG